MAESLHSPMNDFTVVDSPHSLTGVVFHKVMDEYFTDEPLKCVYSLTDSVTPDEGDMIGLYKVGWAHSFEVHSLVPAKFPKNNQRTFLFTYFEGHQLPNESSDLYQFCYITKTGIVGASTPFTFESSEIVAVEDPSDPGLLIFKSRVSQLKDELSKLSDEKSYFTTKYAVLNENFLKLKSEFDKLELDLKNERTLVKQLQDTNYLLANNIKDLTPSLENKEPVIIEDNFITDSVSENANILATKNLEQNKEDLKMFKQPILENAIWSSLHEIYEAAIVINQSMKSSHLNEKCMSYEAFITYILDMVSSTKKKFYMKDNFSEKQKHCECYFKQKEFCCPKLCSESQFEYMMMLPLYMFFSEINHYTKDGMLHCGGCFDSTSLSNYMTAALPPSNSPVNNSDYFGFKYDIQLSSDSTEEKLNKELKEAREKVATLNSRVNVLELELVAQQTNHGMIKTRMVKNNRYFPSTRADIKSTDIESILESMRDEYIKLNEKYDELSKKKARYNSIEECLTTVQHENKMLKEYISIQDENKKCENCAVNSNSDLKKIIQEKEKVENKLRVIQKESIGKVSLSLIRQDLTDFFSDKNSFSPSQQ